METYTAKQRFFHKGQLIKPGEVIELNYAEAARYQYLGFVNVPEAKPKRSTRKAKNARFTN